MENRKGEDTRSWGDHFLPGERAVSINSEKVGLLLKDLGTAMKGVFGLHAKTKVATVMSMREFGGETRWRHFASDNSKELVAAAQNKLMLHLRSTPYRPESTGLIEREVGILGQGIRTALAQSGLPRGYWVYAG